MRISIAQNVLEDPRWFPILDVALLVVEDDRHALAVEEIDALLASRWVSDRGANTRDFIRLSATARSVDALADKQTVVIDSTARRGGEAGQDLQTRVHPLDAILFLSTPFQVIVENEWYDGGFLLWMAYGLGFPQLLNAYHKHRFVFRHAGGKDSIERSAKVFSESVWPRSDRATDRAFRQWMCAVLDNDARDADDDVNHAIISSTSPHVNFVYQLRRRAIESYLSKETLLGMGRGEAFALKVEALFRMTPDQQRYYHMKRGFRFQKDIEPTKANFLEAVQIRAGQKALYRDIDEADWTHLKDGLGGGLSSIFVDPQKRPATNQADLVSTEDREELLSLFRSIYENL